MTSTSTRRVARNRRRIAALGLGLIALACSGVAAAADAVWKPDRPVTLVVPYSPGGGTDAQTRVVARELQRIWGQPVVVDNTAGADGLIGTQKVIKAPPDGLMLLVQLPSLTMIKNLPTYHGVDPVTQLIPISLFSQLAGVVAVNKAVPGQTMAELVKHCKAPGQSCSLGTTEIIARLQAKMLATDSDIPNLIIANYKGGGQLITDLIANNVNMALMGITAVQPHVQSGALRVVMTMGPKRSRVLPDVPSAVEAGFPSFASVTWYGLFAPQGTPPAIVQGVATALKEVVRQDAVLQAFGKLGAEPVANTPAEFAAFVKTEAEHFTELSKRFPIVE